MQAQFRRAMATIKQMVSLAVALVVLPVEGQSCSDACPPVDSGGNPVPSLCPGDTAVGALAGVDLSVCHPPGTPRIQISNFIADSNSNGLRQILVIANHYIGCEAGRREANIYSYTSTLIHSKHPNVVFLSSLKGGTSAQCKTWAELYEAAGVVKLSSLVPEVKQPLTVDDSSSVLRDHFFTAPYPHPSYIIIDHHGRVRHKFVGPCCGYTNYNACSEATALALNETLHKRIAALLSEIHNSYGGSADCILSDWTSWPECSCNASARAGFRERTRIITQNAIGQGTCKETKETEACECHDPVSCEVGAWADWSDCSANCGDGERFRMRDIVVKQSSGGEACPVLAQLGVCRGPPCAEHCVPRLGKKVGIKVVASATDGLHSPRDIAFTPTPGVHLGSFSSGRNFAVAGDEAWVANGAGHSITIVTGVGGLEQHSITRYDRGWYHYMINITALSFNMVKDSGRHPSRDTFAFFATCQDNSNTYASLKEPNFFQGPTLYSSAPHYKNLVRNDGGVCTGADECFFLHADMLHESPSCPGIVHDPETATAYGTVYWAIDGVAGHLVRYDFQQPHGPGLMDHSIAAVRRYPEVNVTRGALGVHQGMAIDAANRALYVASSGSGEVVKVLIDTGRYARTAREEYPIFSSRLPSFEYSIYSCVVHSVFAHGLHTPSGLALIDSMLFVAEFESGRIVVFDVDTAVQINAYETAGAGLMGLSFAPGSGFLHGVNSVTNELLEFAPSVPCDQTLIPYINLSYSRPTELLQEELLHCSVDNALPEARLFEQVHSNTGYASDNLAVQNDSMMDAEAALLSLRTDCEPNSTLNFDALLLGGQFCHVCLPDNCFVRDGGRCTNIQWSGYSCDNEIRIHQEARGESRFSIGRDSLTLEYGRTYRFIVNSHDAPIYIASRDAAMTPAIRVGILRVSVLKPFPVAVMGPNGTLFPISVSYGETAMTNTTVNSTKLKGAATAQRSTTVLPATLPPTTTAVLALSATTTTRIMGVILLEVTNASMFVGERGSPASSTVKLALRRAIARQVGVQPATVTVEIMFNTQRRLQGRSPAALVSVSYIIDVPAHMRTAGLVAALKGANVVGFANIISQELKATTSEYDVKVVSVTAHAIFSARRSKQDETGDWVLAVISICIFGFVCLVSTAVYFFRRREYCHKAHVAKEVYVA